MSRSEKFSSSNGKEERDDRGSRREKKCIEKVYTFDVVGRDGAQGRQGSQGRQGAQGGFGAQGTQGQVGAQGAQGTQGQVGAQGGFGAQGTQGQVGAQGGFGAQGLQGSQGAQGGFGAQGLQGSQGTQGGLGAQGTQGQVGAQGGLGGQGPQGLVGSQGGFGAQGTQGQVGAQGGFGAQGTQGGFGAQGTQGGFGAQGTQGGLGAQGAQGPDALLVNNTVFVDAQFGNDATGVPEDMTKPFQTFDAAVSAALVAAAGVETYTVWFRPGTYISGSLFTLTNSLDLYLEPEAIIDNPRFLLDGAAEFVVAGDGLIRTRGSTFVTTTAISSSTIFIWAREIVDQPILVGGAEKKAKLQKFNQQVNQIHENAKDKIKLQKAATSLPVTVNSKSTVQTTGSKKRISKQSRYAKLSPELQAKLKKVNRRNSVKSKQIITGAKPNLKATPVAPLFSLNGSFEGLHVDVKTITLTVQQLLVINGPTSQATLKVDEIVGVETDIGFLINVTTLGFSAAIFYDVETTLVTAANAFLMTRGGIYFDARRIFALTSTVDREFPSFAFVLDNAATLAGSIDLFLSNNAGISALNGNDSSLEVGTFIAAIIGIQWQYALTSPTMNAVFNIRKLIVTGSPRTTPGVGPIGASIVLNGVNSQNPADFLTIAGALFIYNGDYIFNDLNGVDTTGKLTADFRVVNVTILSSTTDTTFLPGITYYSGNGLSFNSFSPTNPELNIPGPQVISVNIDVLRNFSPLAFDTETGLQLFPSGNGLNSGVDVTTNYVINSVIGWFNGAVIEGTVSNPAINPKIGAQFGSIFNCDAGIFLYGDTVTNPGFNVALPRASISVNAIANTVYGVYIQPGDVQTIQSEISVRVGVFDYEPFFYPSSNQNNLLQTFARLFFINGLNTNETEAAPGLRQRLELEISEARLIGNALEPAPDTMVVEWTYDGAVPEIPGYGRRTDLVVRGGSSIAAVTAHVEYYFGGRYTIPGGFLTSEAFLDFILAKSINANVILNNNLPPQVDPNASPQGLVTFRGKYVREQITLGEAPDTVVIEFTDSPIRLQDAVVVATGNDNTANVTVDGTTGVVYVYRDLYTNGSVVNVQPGLGAVVSNLFVQ